MPTDPLLLLRRLQSPAGQWDMSHGEPVHRRDCLDAGHVAWSWHSPFGLSSLNRSTERFSSANPTFLPRPNQGKQARLCQAEIQLFSSETSPHFQKH